MTKLLWISSLLRGFWNGPGWPLPSLRLSIRRGPGKRSAWVGPGHQHFCLDRWYGNHVQMDGLWHCFMVYDMVYDGFIMIVYGVWFMTWFYSHESLNPKEMEKWWKMMICVGTVLSLWWLYTCNILWTYVYIQIVCHGSKAEFCIHRCGWSSTHGRNV